MSDFKFKVGDVVKLKSAQIFALKHPETAQHNGDGLLAEGSVVQITNRHKHFLVGNGYGFLGTLGAPLVEEALELVRYGRVP